MDRPRRSDARATTGCGPRAVAGDVEVRGTSRPRSRDLQPTSRLVATTEVVGRRGGAELGAAAIPRSGVAQSDRRPAIQSERLVAEARRQCGGCSIHAGHGRRCRRGLRRSSDPPTPSDPMSRRCGDVRMRSARSVSIAPAAARCSRTSVAPSRHPRRPARGPRRPACADAAASPASCARRRRPGSGRRRTNDVTGIDGESAPNEPTSQRWSVRRTTRRASPARAARSVGPRSRASSVHGCIGVSAATRPATTLIMEPPRSWAWARRSSQNGEPPARSQRSSASRRSIELVLSAMKRYPPPDRAAAPAATAELLVEDGRQCRRE